MKSQKSIIELCKESMKFAAAHFTMFSATNRENLHGHTYRVEAALHTTVLDNGLSYDYRYYKEKIHALCRELNQVMLVPTQSKYLIINESTDHVEIIFNQAAMKLLKRDVKLLPICNITVEELSRWFIERLTTDPAELASHKIAQIVIKVFSGPGQSGSCQWAAD